MPVVLSIVLSIFGRAHADSPTAERQSQPSSEQLAAIEKFQSLPPTSIELRDFLQQEMMKVENEALAERLVELCLQARGAIPTLL